MCDLSDRKQCEIPSNAQRQGMCNSYERHAVINIYSIHVSFLHLILPTITFILNMHTHTPVEMHMHNILFHRSDRAA